MNDFIHPAMTQTVTRLHARHRCTGCHATMGAYFLPFSGRRSRSAAAT